jgi:hypothetical protein
MLDSNALKKLLALLVCGIVVISCILSPIDSLVYQCDSMFPIEMLFWFSDSIIIIFNAIPLLIGKFEAVSLVDLALSLVPFISGLLTAIDCTIFSKLLALFRLLNYRSVTKYLRGKFTKSSKPMEFRRVTFILQLSLMIQFLTCSLSIWFFIACPFNKIGCKSDPKSWVYYDELTIVTEPYSIVVRSAYFIIQTLFTVGYGDISVNFGIEMIFSIVLMVIAVAFNGFLISGVASLLKHANASFFNNQRETQELRKLGRSNGWSDSFQDSLLEFKSTVFQKQNGVATENLFSIIPYSLMEKIKINSFQNLIVKQALDNSFHGLNSTVLCSKIEMRILPRGYTFFGQSELEGVIIIKSGKISQECGEGNQSKQIKFVAGDVMFDYDHIFSAPITGIFKTESICDIGFIPRKVLDELLDRSRSVRSKFVHQDCVIDSSGSKLLYSFDPDPLFCKHQQFLVRKNALMSEQGNKRRGKVGALLQTFEANSNFLANQHQRYYFNRIIWQMLLIISYIYYCLKIPFKIIVLLYARNSWWDRDLSNFQFLDSLDFFCDFLLILDLILEFRYFPVEVVEENLRRFEYDPIVIKEAFFQSKMLGVRLVITLPLDLFSIGLNRIWLFRLNKVLALFLIRPGMSKMRDMIERYDFSFFIKYQDLLHILEQLSFAVIIVVWSSCMWQGERYDGHRYYWISSFYWCLTTITTTGFGDIVPSHLSDTVISMLTILLGPTIFTVMIAHVVTYIEG